MEIRWTTISDDITKTENLTHKEFLHEWFRIRVLVPHIGDFDEKDFIIIVNSPNNVEIILCLHH